MPDSLRELRRLLPMLLLLLLLLLVDVLAPARADVIQVQVLARHGLRNLFERDEIHVWDDGGQLSGHGYAQMAAMGAAFRDRYVSGSGSGGGGRAAPGLNGTGLARAALVRSTDSLTSMMSATAFTLGLVPPGLGPVDERTGRAALPGQLDPVGVHTVPMPLDIPLRAYDKCPAFHDGLDALMGSGEIAAWQAQHGPALARLGQHVRAANVTAATFLDAFEILAVEDGFGNLTGITEAEYAEYEKMAAFVGEKMFTGANTNRMLAGRLLANMAQQIALAVDVRNVTVPFIYLSGQYPTMMATYSALGVYGSRAGIPAELPSPGSALVVELHQNSTEQSFAVRVLVHDPSRRRNFTEIALDRCGGQAMCPLDSFMALLSTEAIGDPAAWCALCNNTMTPPCNTNKTVSVQIPAGPCTPADPAEAAGTGTGSSGAGPDRASTHDRSVPFAIVTGIGFGLILAIVIYAMVRCVKSGVVSERLLPRVQDAWRGCSNRTPNHVELQA